MNLVIDFGNTRIKAGLFSNNKLSEKRVFNEEDDLVAWIEKDEKISNVMIASVTRQHENVLAYCESKFNTLLFKAGMPTPLKNLYKSATLGSDRLAAAVGAFSLFPSRDVLTIDAGTCIKYNFVNASNEYRGGAISPGLGMRLRAMHEFTSALPLVEINNSYEKLTGENTAESILSGALMGAACEADAMITRYLDKYPGLQVVVTGGDGDYLCRQLKNPFFANQNILLIGLNTILNHQLEN